jgi:hypothetical protein
MHARENLADIFIDTVPQEDIAEPAFQSILTLGHAAENTEESSSLAATSIDSIHLDKHPSNDILVAVLQVIQEMRKNVDALQTQLHDLQLTERKSTNMTNA